jgi:hypothetical protein
MKPNNIQTGAKIIKLDKNIRESGIIWPGSKLRRGFIDLIAKILKGSKMLKQNWQSEKRVVLSLILSVILPKSQLPSIPPINQLVKIKPMDISLP